MMCSVGGPVHNAAGGSGRRLRSKTRNSLLHRRWFVLILQWLRSFQSLGVIYENAQIDLINLRERTFQITLLFGHAHTTHNAVKYINVYVNICDKDLSI